MQWLRLEATFKKLPVEDKHRIAIELNRAKERGETWRHVYVECMLEFNALHRVGPDS